MNEDRITFSGNVGSRVELGAVGEGVAVASFRVGSTPRRLRDGRWEDGETAWYTVKAWRQLADNLAASLSVGDPVLVTGRVSAETWTAQDGTLVTRHVVVAASVGHDLTRGRSTFVRPGRQQPQVETPGDAVGEDTEEACAAMDTDAGDPGRLTSHG
ncbi:single-stranded DNA-binding protein [Nocardioides yefusunii]|uniref:Single-stranded DNA-binding protein n=1 Tax=Nocardioides yefusunii TaxID=2500546 RepID=A0ABW1QY58_9ACTN|nr:single-stranded DNA-binding protein [Nocardioides yefusunii]